MTKFVIMGNAHEYCEVMCGVIIDREEVVFINKPVKWKTLFCQLLDRKLKGKTGFPLFSSDGRKKSLRSHAPDAQNTCFIFFDSNNWAKDEEFLKHIRKRYNARLVLYVMNPVSSGITNPQFCNNFYDAVFTVFPGDAGLYGWHACNHLYPEIFNDQAQANEVCDTDVFFAGRAKDRLNIIHQTYDFLTGHNIKCDFHIAEVNKKMIRHHDGIIYNKWLPYREILKRVRKSRCVMEILQRPGTGPTLRMAEAVVFNKKIITNDAAAVSGPFYDSRFVTIFDDPEKIDLSYIHDGIKPQYNCQERYSANNFLKLVEETLAAKSSSTIILKS